MIAATTTDLLTVRDAAAQRRSIRAFRPEPIPRADLDAILETVALAPSAFNVQPWRFVVVEDVAVKARLAAAAFNQRQVTAAPAAIVLYTDMADALETVDEVIHPGMDDAARTSTRASILKPFEAQSTDEREAWGVGQGNIALGYLLLAAESHGYQTSPMLGFDPGAVKTLLGLPHNVRIPAIIAIGKGAETGFEHHRHGVDRITRYV
ncbi:MAG: nitroreductase family protein [Gemmatimonadaceae bacterium]